MGQIQVILGGLIYLLGIGHLIIKLARGEKLTGIGIASIFLYIILGLFFVFQIIK